MSRESKKPKDLRELIKKTIAKSKNEGKLQSMIQKSIKNLTLEGVDIEDMIVGGLARSFAKLPEHVEEIIERYVGKVPESGKWTSEAIIAGFNMLSVNIRKKVIKKIADDEDPTAREWAVYMFIKNFNNFSKEVREEILIKFSDDKDVNVKSGALLMVVMKFSQLSKNIQRLLKKFAEDKNPEVRIIAAYALAYKFKEISPFGNLLKNLAEDKEDSVRRAVAYAIVKNFHNLDEDIQKILVKLSEDRSMYVKKGIANVIIANKGLKRLPIYQRIFEALNKDKKMRSYIEELTCAYSS